MMTCERSEHARSWEVGGSDLGVSREFMMGSDSGRQVLVVGVGCGTRGWCGGSDPNLGQRWGVGASWWGVRSSVAFGVVLRKLGDSFSIWSPSAVVVVKVSSGSDGVKVGFVGARVLVRRRVGVGRWRRRWWRLAPFGAVLRKLGDSFTICSPSAMISKMVSTGGDGVK